MGLDDFLSRLQGVKRSGDRWIARCPSHPDRSPSLSVRGESDGRILVHCFAGCDPGEVLGAIGVQFTDLFPEPLTREFLPRVPQPFSAFDALKCLAAESAIVSILASDIALGIAIAPADLDRASVAAGRIASALEVVHG